MVPSALDPLIHEFPGPSVRNFFFLSSSTSNVLSRSSYSLFCGSLYRMLFFKCSSIRVAQVCECASFVAPRNIERAQHNQECMHASRSHSTKPTTEEYSFSIPSTDAFFPLRRSWAVLPSWPTSHLFNMTAACSTIQAKIGCPSGMVVLHLASNALFIVLSNPCIDWMPHSTTPLDCDAPTGVISVLIRTPGLKCLMSSIKAVTAGSWSDLMMTSVATWSGSHMQKT